MKRFLLVLLTLTAFALLCTAGYASSTEKYHDKDLPEPKSFNAHFGNMDADGDEFVDWEEFKTHFPQANPDIFGALDLNKDNAIDHDEWHQFKAAHKMKHGTSDTQYHDKPLPDPKSFNAHFGDMDADGDEFVDWEEFKTHFPQANPDIFGALDLNSDNAIDHDEWHQFKAAHKMKHGTSDTQYHDKPLPDPKSFNAHFGDMDADGDEFVDWEEFEAHFPQANPDIFEALDLNGDNAIDHDEWHQFKAAHGLKHVE